MDRFGDGEYVTFADHEADCEKRIAEAVRAERDRCRREEVALLLEAVREALSCARAQWTSVRYYQDALAAIEAKQKESP